MTPDELLRLYPRETLRWLRRRQGLTQRDLGDLLGVRSTTVADWEAPRRNIGPANRVRLAALLTLSLATPEGEAFARSLGRDGEG